MNPLTLEEAIQIISELKSTIEELNAENKELTELLTLEEKTLITAEKEDSINRQCKQLMEASEAIRLKEMELQNSIKVEQDLEDELRKLIRVWDTFIDKKKEIFKDKVRKKAKEIAEHRLNAMIPAIKKKYFIISGLISFVSIIVSVIIALM